MHGFRSTFRDCAAELAKFRNSLWSGSGIRSRIRRKPPTGTKSIEEAAPALGVAFGASSDPPLSWVPSGGKWKYRGRRPTPHPRGSHLGGKWNYRDPCGWRQGGAAYMRRFIREGTPVDGRVARYCNMPSSAVGTLGADDETSAALAHFADLKSHISRGPRSAISGNRCPFLRDGNLG